MKLESLVEAVNNLTQQRHDNILDAIRNAGDVDEAKEEALELSTYIKGSDKENFIKSVEAAGEQADVLGVTDEAIKKITSNSSVTEAVARTSDDLKHARGRREEGKSIEPERLDVFLDYIKNSGDVEEAKEHARRMSKWFTKGGADKFMKAIDNAKDMVEVLTIAYNTALKGEGLGVINKGRTGRTSKTARGDD